MAPEQSKPGCVIDARADQFSLCVALFEALYRQRPRGEDTRGGAGGHLRDQSRLPSSPRLPKTLGEALRRGLATDPDDRYPTLEPIIAALSHRKASGIDIAKGLLAVAGVSLAGVLMVSPQAPDQASARCPSSQERLRNIWDADRALALAQGLSATGLPYTDNMSARVLTHVRSWVDEWSTAYAETCERMKTGPVDRSGDRRMLCLVGQLRSFETMLNGLAEADTRQPGLGLTAVMSLEPPSACTGAGELPVPSEAHRAEQVAFVRALLARASVAQQLGDLDEAERLGEEALGYGKPIAFPPLNAELEIRQAATGRARGRLEEAAEHARLAFFIAADNDHARAAAQAAEQLVFVVGYRLHRYQEAAQWFRHARTQLERFGGDAQLDAAVHNAFGAVRRIEGAAEHALELHRTAIELRRSAVGRDDEKVAVFLMNSANVLFDLGRYSEGLVVFERVLSLQERSLGPQHPALAQTLNNVGAALLTVGDKERAESFMMRALAVRERSLGADHLLVGRTLSNLGSLARSLGRTLEAANYQARALAILELALGPQHPDLAIVLNNLANTQIDRGELDAAHDALRRSLEIRVSAFGESHDKVSRARMSLAGLHLQRGELDDALVEFSLALDIARAVYPMAHPLKARILTRKADVLLRLGRGDDALHDVQEAVESNAAEPPGPSHLLETQFVHAQALAATGSERRARVVARSAHNRASQMGEHGKAWVDEIGRWLVTLPAPTRNGESSLPPP